jgi:hypothetical protein
VLGTVLGLLALKLLERVGYVDLGGENSESE